MKTYPLLAVILLLTQAFGCTGPDSHPFKERPVEQINHELERRTFLAGPMDVVNFIYSTMYPDFAAAQLVIDSSSDPKDHARHYVTIIDTAFADDRITAMKQYYVLYKGQNDSAWLLEQFKYAWKCGDLGFDTIPCP